MRFVLKISSHLFFCVKTTFGFQLIDLLSGSLQGHFFNKRILQGKCDCSFKTFWGTNQFINQKAPEQVQQTLGDTVQIQDFRKTLATLYVGKRYQIFKGPLHPSWFG